MNKTTINIATEFSRYPGGRFITDGKFSGEAFREKFLLPKLKENEKVVIQMDGTLGYGSSFLDEAFGGLVRKHQYEPEKLLQALSIDSKDPSLEIEIIEYITHSEG